MSGATLVDTRLLYQPDVTIFLGGGDYAITQYFLLIEFIHFHSEEQTVR